MPPRSRSKSKEPKSGKKGKGKKGKKSVDPGPAVEIIDGKHLWLATDALQKEKSLRSYFQLERDRITSFWEVTKQEVEEANVELRQKACEKAELEERNEVETKVYKQKMRHLLYEQQVQITQMKLEAERALKNKQEEYRNRLNELRRDLRDLKLLSKEQEQDQRDTRLHLQTENDRQITDQARDFERQIKDVHLLNEKRFKVLRDDMDKQRKEEIALFERRKEEHEKELREMHDRAFQEIKDYYNEITSNNLETIRTLKDEVYSRRRTEAHNEKAMFDIAQTNKRLTEPLTKAQKQKKQLEQELATYSKVKVALRSSKQELFELEQRLKTLEWENEVLRQRYAKLTEDRDLIFEKYNDVLQDIQKKAIFKRVLVHRKIEVVQSQLERRDAQLAELLKQANVDPDTVEGVCNRVNDLVTKKEQIIEELQKLLASLAERHEKVTSSYETYLRNNGAPGLPTTSLKRAAATGPARLTIAQ